MLTLDVGGRKNSAFTCLYLHSYLEGPIRE